MRREYQRVLEVLLPSILIGVSAALLVASGIRQRNAEVRQEALNEAILNQVKMKVTLDVIDRKVTEMWAGQSAKAVLATIEHPEKRSVPLVTGVPPFVVEAPPAEESTRKR